MMHCPSHDDWYLPRFLKMEINVINFMIKAVPALTSHYCEHVLYMCYVR